MVGDGARSAIAAEVDDIELGERRRADEFVEDEDEEGSQYFTDAEDCILRCASGRRSSYGGDGDIEAGSAHLRKSLCVSEWLLDHVDLEAGLAEIIKGIPDPEKAERNCRICHLGLESAAAESSAGITLSWSCKGDLPQAVRRDLLQDQMQQVVDEHWSRPG